MTIYRDRVIPNSEMGFGSNTRPIRYTYVLADIRTGKMIATLPMTDVSYNVGIYSGTEMSGQVYLPELQIDLMSNTPYTDFERWEHPDQGLPLGSMFEVGNRALYIMRNDEVVWGGILWGRSYSSGSQTIDISGLSWDGYIYYRILRRSVIFLKDTPKYTIWRALLKQVLSDFTWQGDDTAKKTNSGIALDGTSTWTGKTDGKKSNLAMTTYVDRWPYNSPNIEVPPAGLKFTDPKDAANAAFSATENRWRGYDLKSVGSELQTWADANTLVTGGGFEYRVLCWWDEVNQQFRQRYTFGEMVYDNNPQSTNIAGTPTAIKSPLLGRPVAEAEKTIFDFPGHISSWSLEEGMEEAATRVIVSGSGDQAAKIAAYVSNTKLLRPGGAGNGSNGWLLYDKLYSYDTSKPKDLLARAQEMRDRLHPPQAATIDDIGAVNTDQDRRSSMRSTVLSVTLYQNPATTFPSWKLGDWVTFAIKDPFYGGTMYLKRRIIGYAVKVIPDHESAYSHEEITLTLTDDTKIEVSA